MPSFFHPLCKAGWCPAERFCRPLALKTGAWHIVHWTRAPFYEMWGKPKSCREPQDVCHYYNKYGFFRQVQLIVIGLQSGHKKERPGIPERGNC